MSSRTRSLLCMVSLAGVAVHAAACGDDCPDGTESMNGRCVGRVDSPSRPDEGDEPAAVGGGGAAGRAGREPAADGGGGGRGPSAGGAGANADKPGTGGGPSGPAADGGRTGSAGSSGRAGSAGDSAGSAANSGSAGNRSNVEPGTAGAAANSGSAGNGPNVQPGTAGGTAANSGSAGTTPPIPMDICATSVCTDVYPCSAEGASYTCRGQYAAWPTPISTSTWRGSSNGTVTDARSGLVWQRASPDTYPGCTRQITDGAATGSACSLSEAKSYCASLTLAGGGFRLPTKPELESIVDDTRYMPAIDDTAFPSTPPNDYWTSSPYIGDPGNSWIVDFADGMSGQNEDEMIRARVRCVR